MQRWFLHTDKITLPFFVYIQNQFCFKLKIMTSFPVVCFGEILWDVLPTGAKPGGAPMNVAYHLQKLGLAPAVITRVGTDEAGNQLQQLLNDNNITTGYIQTDTQHQTGVVLASLNARAEATYEIVQPVAWDFIKEHEDLKKLVRAARYFIFGSLAARSETSRNTLFQLLENANTKVLDINLRPPHFSNELVEDLIHQCDILKINDQELQQIAGRFGAFETLEEGMDLLQGKFGIETIVTTRGSNGALLYINGKMYAHPGFKISVKDTVGSGDAFLAALLFGLNNNTPPEEALAFANKLGAFVASSEGACPDYTISDIDAAFVKQTF